VAYATCSPVLAETSGVVTAVLAERRDVRLEDAAPLFPGVPDAPGPLPGTVQLWPHRHGTDAMFLALLRRA
jgi:16S rRNA (cytosine967-C5)-methyltransferase